MTVAPPAISRRIAGLVEGSEFTTIRQRSHSRHETSHLHRILSDQYLTSRTSRDLVVAAHQQVMLDFWEGVARFDICISAFVVAEVSKGNDQRAQTRMNLMAGAVMLEASESILHWAKSMGVDVTTEDVTPAFH